SAPERGGRWPKGASRPGEARRPARKVGSTPRNADQPASEVRSTRRGPGQPADRPGPAGSARSPRGASRDRTGASRPARSAGGRRGGAEAAAVDGGEPVRLNKALSGAGLGSRRAVEELVRAGRVSVGGAVVHDLGRR